MTRTTTKFSFLFAFFFSMLSHAQEIDNHVKAIFVYNFSKHLEWPETMKKGDFIIGVYEGSEVLVDEFTKSCVNKKVGIQKVVVRKVTTADEAKICHIVFVPTKSSTAVSALATTLKGTPILLVSEKLGLIKKGAGINIFMDEGDGGRTKFELNKKALEARGLKIGHSLESLAAAVY